MSNLQLIKEKASAYNNNFKVEFIPQSSGRMLENIFPCVGDDPIRNAFFKIEKVARTCYKSDYMMNPNLDRNIKFIYGLFKRQHLSVFEHADFLFLVDKKYWDSIIAEHPEIYKFVDVCLHEDNRKDCILSVRVNMRVLIEYKEVLCKFNYALLDSSVDVWTHTGYGNVVNYIFEPVHSLRNKEDNTLVTLVRDNFVLERIKSAHPNLDSITYTFITDRGVTHELVRHRLCSFAQESTRYVNYANGEKVNFIIPSTLESWSKDSAETFVNDVLGAIESYSVLIDEGKLTPQQARAVLPNCIKTEIVVTATREEWTHIINLRVHGSTGTPHPDIKALLTPVAKDLGML